MSDILHEGQQALMDRQKRGKLRQSLRTIAGELQRVLNMLDDGPQGGDSEPPE